MSGTGIHLLLLPLWWLLLIRLDCFSQLKARLQCLVVLAIAQLLSSNKPGLVREKQSWSIANSVLHLYLLTWHKLKFGRSAVNSFLKMADFLTLTIFGLVWVVLSIYLFIYFGGEVWIKQEVKWSVKEKVRIKALASEVSHDVEVILCCYLWKYYSNKLWTH